MANPNAVMMQYMDLFSHRTVLLPSVVLSHQHDAAVCKPAPAQDNGLGLAFFNIYDQLHCRQNFMVVFKHKKDWNMEHKGSYSRTCKAVHE